MGRRFRKLEKRTRPIKSALTIAYHGAQKVGRGAQIVGEGYRKVQKSESARQYLDAHQEFLYGPTDVGNRIAYAKKKRSQDPYEDFMSGW